MIPETWSDKVLNNSIVLEFTTFTKNDELFGRLLVPAPTLIKLSSEEEYTISSPSFKKWSLRNIILLVDKSTPPPKLKSDASKNISLVLFCNIGFTDAPVPLPPEIFTDTIFSTS